MRRSEFQITNLLLSFAFYAAKTARGGPNRKEIVATVVADKVKEMV